MSVAEVAGSAGVSAGLAAAARKLTQRARLQRAMASGVALASVGAGIACAGALLTRFGYSGFGEALWIAPGLLGLVGAAIGVLRPVRLLPLARALDRALATPDLLASAWAFDGLPAPQRSAFMQACIAEAERASARVSRETLARAMPWQRPRALAALCALSIALISMSHAEANAPKLELPAHSSRAPIVEAETLAAFAEDNAALLEQGALSPEAKDVARSLNALVQAIADGRMDRAEALKELRALEERLQAALADDPEALSDALEKLAKALAGNADAKPLHDALTTDQPKAPQAAKQLAERMESRELSERGAERLASSLKKAAAQSSAGERAAAIERAKRELERLSREPETADGRTSNERRSEREESLLKRKQRELDQLQREQEKAERAERSLEKLKRDLDRSGESLEHKDQSQAAQHMRDAAQSLHDAAERQRQRAQAQRLADQLAQLREEVAQAQRGQRESRDSRDSQGAQSQAQAGGQGERLSVQRFGQLARGQQGSQPAQQPGQGSQRGQQAAQAGKVGQMMGAQPGQSGEPGQGQPGQGAGAQPGRGARAAQALGASEQPGDAEGARSGREGGQGGKPGTGPATDVETTGVDTRVAGEKRGGPSRSEVILESGQHGFASEPYARVHADYERHAESVLEQEKIPGGYRFYVRRYFQMIRPRAASAASSTSAASSQPDTQAP